MTHTFYRSAFLTLALLSREVNAQTSCDTSLCGDGLPEASCKAKKVRHCNNIPVYSENIKIKVLEMENTILQLSVDDHPRVAVKPPLNGQALDISHMFANGINNLVATSY